MISVGIDGLAANRDSIVDFAERYFSPRHNPGDYEHPSP